MNHALKLLWPVILFLVFAACSKSPGKTNSKVKIVSGNFAAFLTSKANNGLFFYGKSADGKFFSKRVDTDTVDLIFPNGTWNFYAISYESMNMPVAGGLPNFTGKTYCGKKSVELSGVDTNIQIDLSNAGCNDSAFSTNTVLEAGIYKLPKAEVMNCRTLNFIGGITACDNITAAKFNKGLASSYRIIALETKNFGDTATPVKIAQSNCILSSYSNEAAISSNSSTVFSDFHIPTSPNGIALAIEVFYSNGSGELATNGCDGSRGVDVVALTEGPRMKFGIDVSTIPITAQFFVKTDSTDVCRDVRLNSSTFAAGSGHFGNPFAICSKAQLSLFRSNYSTYQNSSFELLTDIDYSMATIAPIGPALQDAGGSAGTSDGYGFGTMNAVRFNGNGHKISNFIIGCKTTGGTGVNHDIGFFRKISNGEIKNLTINNGLVICEEGDHIGILAGQVSAASQLKIENVRVHGHSEGRSYVGGIFGQWSGQGGDFTDVHVKGEYVGKEFVGGIVGGFDVTTASSLVRSSFFGSINADKGAGAVSVTKAGGFFGFVNSPLNYLIIDRSLVKAKRIEASTVVGSFIGESNNVKIFDSYAEAVLVASGNTDGTATFAKIGGAVGRASNTTLTKVFVTNIFKKTNKASNDYTVGGLIGSGSNSQCVQSYYTGEQDVNNYTTCGSLVSLTNSRKKSFYSDLGFILPVKLANWDAVKNSPNISSECSAVDVGKFFEVSNFNASSAFGQVLPGDIILCNGTNYTAIALTAIADTFSSAPYTWIMPEDTNEIPRLSWEQKVERELPHLKRECQGHYATQFGSGTASDPFWICSYAQFNAMAENVYYVLKKDIVADTAHTPLPPGKYLLNGNGYSLKNFIVNLPSHYNSGTAYYGIFSRLSPGSVLKDFDVLSSAIISPTSTSGSSGNSSVYIGTLVGFNNGGMIQNVKLDLITSILNVTPSTNDLFFVGGAVGHNAGTMTRMDVRAQLDIFGGIFNTAQSLNAGGVVGLNSASIEGLRSRANISRSFNCSKYGAPLSFGPGEYLGAFGGQNTNSISQVSHEGELRGDLLGENKGNKFTNCEVVQGALTNGFVGKSTGTLEDFVVSPRVALANNPYPVLEVVGAASSGTIRRGLFSIDSQNAFAFLQGMSFSNVGNWNPGTDPYLNAPSVNCSPAEAGNWVDVKAAANESNAFGVAINSGDRIVCNGMKNIVMNGSFFSRMSAVAPAMADVIYMVKDPGGTCSDNKTETETQCVEEKATGSPLLLPANRYYNSNLVFSIGSGLKVETLNPLATLLENSHWSVASDFLNPGANIWSFWFNNGVLTSQRPPELVKASGRPDLLGAPF